VNDEIHWIANRTEAMAMATDNSGTLALLIDGDNASPKIVVGLLAEIANYGLASVKRIYGDWTGPNLKGWKECLLEHSIQPVQHSPTRPARTRPMAQ
jgi:hypothetical protein